MRPAMPLASEGARRGAEPGAEPVLPGLAWVCLAEARAESPPPSLAKGRKSNGNGSSVDADVHHAPAAIAAPETVRRRLGRDMFPVTYQPSPPPAGRVSVMLSTRALPPISPGRPAAGIGCALLDLAAAIGVAGAAIRPDRDRRGADNQGVLRAIVAIGRIVTIVAAARLAICCSPRWQPLRSCPGSGYRR